MSSSKQGFYSRINLVARWPRFVVNLLLSFFMPAHFLGSDYRVGDTSGNIQFPKPGHGTVHAHF